MNNKTRKASIIGIGNFLMADEGFGVHVLKFLEENYTFPKEIRLIDCGTAGIYMAPVFENADIAMVIDAASIEGHGPGDIVVLDHRGMSGRMIQSSMSPHQIGVLEVLEICRLRGNLPSTILFFLAIPKEVAPGVELSETLRPKVLEVANMVVDRLRKEGFSIKDA